MLYVQVTALRCKNIPPCVWHWCSKNFVIDDFQRAMFWQNAKSLQLNILKENPTKMYIMYTVYDTAIYGNV